MSSLKIIHKIILFTLFASTIIITVVFLSIENTENLKSQDYLRKAQSNVLQASKYYSDFVKKRNTKFIEQFNNNIDTALYSLNESELNGSHVKIESKLVAYKNYVNQNISLWKTRGLNEDSGIEGIFRSKVHEIEDILYIVNLDKLLIYILQARRSEKDFIMRRNKKYVDRVSTMIENLKQEVKNVSLSKEKKNTIITLANNYLKSFNTLVSILNEIDRRNLKILDKERNLLSVIDTEINKASNESEQFIFITIFLYVLLTTILLIVSYSFIKTIVRPIEYLRKSTNQIANGNYNLRVNINSQDEIGELARSFNKMVNKFYNARKSLEELNSNLEKRVKNRTIELEREVEERKNAEKKLENYNEEIKKTLKKEKELGDLKTKFISMVSHEYRTPLTIIMTSTYIIENYLKMKEPENAVSQLKKIQSSVEEMKELLEDTLSFGKIESNKIKVYKEEVNLSKHLDMIINDFKTISKDFEFIKQSPIEEVFICTDANIIHHVFNNLINNAIKFSNKEKLIKVTVELKDNSVEVLVTDFGIGIPEEDKKNIFTPFYRSDNVNNISGTGLGLSIVKRYVEAIGGNIDFSSYENVGTTFCVSLPTKNLKQLKNTKSSKSSV